MPAGAQTAEPESANGAQNAYVSRESLKNTILSFPDPGCAVIDGAFYEDFSAFSRKSGLFARSLFLHHADAEAERAGPWIVNLGQVPDALDKILSLVGDMPAAVFWSCADGELPLYKHLRTLNLVRIPSWAASSELSPRTEETDQISETVMFRHWDPRVLGALMPVLDARQFRRIIGPAQEICFWAGDYGGLKRLVSDPTWPPMPAGMLAIRTEQINLLENRLISASRNRIKYYLRDTAGPETNLMDDDQLMAIIIRSEHSALEIGLSSERSFGLWTYLMVRTEGTALERPGVRSFLTESNRDPDEQVDRLFDAIINLGNQGSQKHG